MLNKHNINRPDQELEKVLSALVYTIVALVLSMFMLFIYPQYSLYLIVVILGISVLCIALAIKIMSASEEAITYGGFANEILNSRSTINRIDNNKGEAIIENFLSKKFFLNLPVLDSLNSRLIDERQNHLNFQRLELAIKGLKPENVILKLNIDNEEKWYRLKVRPLYLKKSDIFEEEFSIKKIEKETYFLWSLADITAEQNMEKIFEEERKKLHHFINHLPIGVYIANKDYVLEYANETFAAQLSLPRETVIGKSLISLIPNSQGALNPKIEHFTGYEIFQSNPHENTELYLVQNRFQDDGSDKISGLSLQKLPTDNELKQQLFLSKDEVKWLFTTTPSGIIFINKSHNIVSANDKAMEILENKDLNGSKLSNYFQTSTIQILDKIYQEYASDSQNNTINKLETRLKSDKVVRIYTAPQRHIYSSGDDFSGLILYIEDTTEQKNLELRFAQAQKMQAMGQLAGGVAHDFNNLLTAMIGFCDLLLQRHGIGDPSFADLIQIKQNANRAAGLVRQLLAFSRKQPLKPKKIDVTENFVDLSHLLKRILGEQISLEFNHGKDLGFIRVDPVQFSQVIINLAVNAKDAMNGKGLLKISTHTETLTEPYQFGADTISPGEFVVISVQDTGCGIPKENLNRIFEPFFSTKQNVVGSGTGLGLAMVYGIVRQTEGFIKVDSTVGKGTTFSIHLPRFETADDDAETPQSTENTVSAPILNSATGGQPQKLIMGLNVSKVDHHAEPNITPQDIKILFVEDEDSVRAFGVRALKKKGFSVSACNCAENALDLVDRGEKFNLLLTDMVMPGLSGADLAKAIKQKQPEIKIILASGYSEEIARRELAGSDDFEFIAKPYSLGDLTKKVFDILNQ